MTNLQSTFFRCVALALKRNSSTILFSVIAGISLLSLTSTTMAQAPGWSRGQQNLALSYDDCVRRAPSALQAEGYRIDANQGNFSVGIKGVHTGVIICSPAPDSRMFVQIVVASNGDGGGVERQRLQARMEGESSTGGVGGGAGVSGTWDLVCCGNKYSGVLVLVQNGNNLTGYMISEDQKIVGTINGNQVQFTRYFSLGQQNYRLTLSPDGRTLRGDFDGARDMSVTTETTITKRP